jgi:hypothetical protein
MPSTKQQVRVLLEPGVASEVNHIAKRESRAIASVCSVLIGEALYQRRCAAAQVAQVSRLTELLRTPIAEPEAS